MKADELLQCAGAAVRDRRQSYGEPADLFAQIARRWSLVLGVPVTPAQAVICMLEIKLARLTHQPRHRDSIIDLAATAPSSGRSCTMADAKRRSRTAKLPRRHFQEVREQDPDGRNVVHHRTVVTLGRILEAGTITPEMESAAKDFQAAFILAQLDPIRALSTLQVPGTGHEPELNERQLDARRRVHEALQGLGGLSSPAGSCVWHVIGLQRSIREWAIRQGWNGRPVDQKQAQGILVAALGMLAVHGRRTEARHAS